MKDSEETTNKSLELLRHTVDLLAAKDPMTYQAIAQDPGPGVDYDPSDEAEAQRMRERGLSDNAIYDEWSVEDDTDLAIVRSEIYGE